MPVRLDKTPDTPRVSRVNRQGTLSAPILLGMSCVFISLFTVVINSSDDDTRDRAPRTASTHRAPCPTPTYTQAAREHREPGRLPAKTPRPGTKTLAPRKPVKPAPKVPAAPKPAPRKAR
ncbi:hypothetical protein AB0G86_18635 [Streptomyces scabiei]|uniref:hypothetical protein n=1 Tax=Streptomyces scabiei TaxID=1930 RepID=UPI0033E17969